MSFMREITRMYPRKKTARRRPSTRLNARFERWPPNTKRSASWVSQRGSRRKTTAPNPRPTAIEPAIAQLDLSFGLASSASGAALAFSSSVIAASAEKLSARMPIPSDWNSTAMPRSTGSLRIG
jgi:hypothetical protein